MQGQVNGRVALAMQMRMRLSEMPDKYRLFYSKYLTSESTSIEHRLYLESNRATISVVTDTFTAFEPQHGNIELLTYRQEVVDRPAHVIVLQNKPILDWLR